MVLVLVCVMNMIVIVADMKIRNPKTQGGHIEIQAPGHNAASGSEKVKPSSSKTGSVKDAVLSSLAKLRKAVSDVSIAVDDEGTSTPCLFL